MLSLWQFCLAKTITVEQISLFKLIISKVQQQEMEFNDGLFDLSCVCRPVVPKLFYTAAQFQGYKNFAASLL